MAFRGGFPCIFGDGACSDRRLTQGAARRTMPARFGTISFCRRASPTERGGAARDGLLFAGCLPRHHRRYVEPAMPNRVQYSPAIEPLVQFFEETLPADIGDSTP